MGLNIIKELPGVREVSARYPVTGEHRIVERRREIQRVLSGEDQRLLMVIGPCSAWPFGAVEEYAEKLAGVQEEVRERVLCVLRTYIQKPRTTIGWPGPLNQPDPLGSVDIERGIWECRKLMHTVGKLLPLADEMVFTHNAPHFEPLLSYIAVGARSAEDMEHRYIASQFDCAVGVKNATSGDIEVGVNGVQCIQASHTFALHQMQVETDGNPYAHLVLRGGKTGSNYDPRSLAIAHRLLREKKVEHPAVLVDASHDNSLNGHGKDPEHQTYVVRNVLQGILDRRDEYALIRGFMIESFLRGGSQPIGSIMTHDGCSITDPCLPWESTEKLLYEIADACDR